MALDVRHRNGQNLLLDLPSVGILGSATTTTTNTGVSVPRTPSHNKQGGNSSSSINNSNNRNRTMSGVVILAVSLLAMVATLGTIMLFVRTLPTTRPSWSGIRATGVALSSSSNNIRTMVDRSLYDHIRQDNMLLQKQVIEMKKSQVTQAHVVTTDEQTRATALGQHVARLNDVTRQLRHEIQTISKRALWSKYGPGPHYVEFVLAFDPASNVASAAHPIPPQQQQQHDDNTVSLIILMASEDDMPATVYHFLEQINATLYDGASFHRSAGHVVQAGPTPNFESKTKNGGGNKNLIQPFKTAGLEHVPFQE